MKKEIKLKRDPSVELARIIACMIVIGVHTCLSSEVNGKYDFSRVFISCVLGDGVAVFWLIAGFFCFRNDYKKMLNKTWHNIGMPMLVFTGLTFIFADWLLNGATLLQSVHHTKEQYIDIIKALMTWNNGFPYCSHLWYLYTYILIALAFPVLKCFVAYLDEIPEVRWRIFIAISIIILIINDMISNQMCDFSLKSSGAVFPAALDVVYGYYLYKHRTIFQKRIYIFLAPVMFVVLNIIRTFIQYNRYQSDPTNNWILFWFSSFGVLCATCIVVFSFALDNAVKSTSAKATVCRIASCTLYIYLIHPFVISILSKHGLQDWIDSCLKPLKGCSYDISYTMLIILAVFSFSLICANLIKCISTILHPKA